MQVQQSEAEVTLVSVNETVAETPIRLRSRATWVLQKTWELAFRKAKTHLAKLPIVWSGHLINWRESPSYRLHWYADGLAFLLGTAFLVPLNSWFWLFLAAVLKAGAEALNTSHEKHADYEWPRRQVGSTRIQHNRTAKEIKDSAAYAVGLTVAFSLAVWAFIFIPEFWRLIA